jgi:hypothetical protein
MGATLVISIAGAAAMASVLGGLIALWRIWFQSVDATLWASVCAGVCKPRVCLGL